MVNFLNKLLGVILLFLFITTTVVAAEITATVDRNPIPVGESFQFVLDARGSIDEEPDFSELNNVFKILNRSQSSNFRLINGSITRNKTWTMELIADKPGTYVIPAINFGKDKSNPISINIVSNTVIQGSNRQAEIYLEIDVEPKSAYVQQQIIYTIKLFRRIRLSNASLSEPVSKNNQTIITRLGEDTDKKIVINGVPYSVLERRYAIFPQKSGTLKIAPLTFETQIVNNSQQSLFSNMDRFTARAKIKQIKSKAVEIQVKGIPAEFTKKYPQAAWLPVDNLTITESWSGDINSFKSGEPMTRTISLKAQNLSASQLPDVKLVVPKNIKAYPDVPVITEQNNLKGLIANKQFKTALLPTKMGKHKLPKIVIPWWNTNTNSIQESSLPAHTINVATAANQNDDYKLKLDEGLSTQLEANKTPQMVPEEKVGISEAHQSEQPLPFVWIIVCVILALFWLLTIYLFLQLRSKYNLLISKADPDNLYKSVSRPISTKEIKKACLDNDANTCSHMLIQWANSQTESDKFTNLSSLLPYVDQELSEAIEELEHHLYGSKSEEWNGVKIWTAFNLKPPVFVSKNNAKLPNPSLPSLYANYK